MSLIASVAPPLRNRRPAHRPRAADAATPRDFLEALRLRIKLKFTEEKAALHLGVTRKTLRNWCRRGMKLPEAKQILSGPLD